MFIWNPASPVWSGLEYPHGHRLALMFNVLQLQSMLKLEALKASITHSKPELRNPLPVLSSKTLFLLPNRLLFPLCPLYLECIVNMVNANMGLQDKKQLWSQVKCSVVVCVMCSWLQCDGGRHFRRMFSLGMIGFDSFTFVLLKGAWFMWWFGKSSHVQLCLNEY